MAFYGGYPPGGGQRNPREYLTILSGDIDANGTPDMDNVVTGADNAGSIKDKSEGKLCKKLFKNQHLWLHRRHIYRSKIKALRLVFI